MAQPKRFTAPVGESIREDPEGNFTYWSEYEALVEAFALYAREGMDSAQEVYDTLEPHLGADAGFVAELIAKANDEDIVVGGKT
jgi:hypothetical protein